MYGFKDKDVALRLKKMANGGGVPNAAADSPSQTSTPQYMDIVNETGSAIPPFGLVFASKPVTSGGVAALSAFTYSQIKQQSNVDRFIPLFNVAVEIPSGHYGSAQFAGEFFHCLLAGDSPNVGATVYPSSDTDFHLSTDGDTAGGGWSYVAAFPASVLGADTSQDVALVRVLGGSDAGTAFFYTGATGIPAAASKQQPGSEELWRQTFDSETGTIDPANEKEMVYNHTMSAVGPEKMIQCKKIDGAWFIDVEPCGS